MEKAGELANKIWELLNEVDYDPLHPQLKYFDDPIKDEIIEFSKKLLGLKIKKSEE